MADFQWILLSDVFVCHVFAMWIQYAPFQMRVHHKFVKTVFDQTNQEESEEEEAWHTGENLSFTLKDKFTQKHKCSQHLLSTKHFRSLQQRFDILLSSWRRWWLVLKHEKENIYGLHANLLNPRECNAIQKYIIYTLNRQSSLCT